MSLKSENRILAFDLGASSGRAIVGHFDEKKRLKLEELYRFQNRGVPAARSLYWDVLNIYNEMLHALLLYGKKYGPHLDSIGIDTWGVTFVFLDENDELIGPVHHYRDKRTVGMVEEMCKVIPKEDIFKITGVQFMELNSSTQLFSMVRNKSSRLSIARSFLMLPDYFNFLFSGVKVCEFSDATTTQLYNPVKKDWAFELIHAFRLKSEWFLKIIPGGTILGNIKQEIAKEAGLSTNIKIIAPLTHDTGSAYAAVPVEMNKFKEGEYAILSSGTWSLMGVELKEPLISDKALKYNYTNEGGVNGSIRFLKNIAGMWLVQECKQLWEKAGLNLSWEDIEREASKENSFSFFINPDDHAFMNPSNMIDEIKAFCKRTNQSIPSTVGQIARGIFESLALRYREVLENLEDITEKKVKILYIIGGGSQNQLLDQFTANALNIPVKAGPSEATAIGNILIQALAMGNIESVAELREVVRMSFEVKEYLPKDTDAWNKAYSKFKKTSR